MARIPVVFDLDRTLLRGASGPAISDALHEVGLGRGRKIPGQGLVFGLFDLIGETRPSMMLTRQFARMASGWERTRVQEAGRRVAQRLIDQVPPFARATIEEHREAGRTLVMATTTPHDLVAPLAEVLGLDAVVATRYGEVDGHYDGNIVGEFVWGKGKLRAVAEWAESVGADLSEGYAYSDSYYDRPLLGAVAHPVAVNPDPRLAAYAVLRRWPLVWFDVPPGVPKLGGLVEPQRLVMPFARPELFAYARFDVEGLEHVPDEGPAIIAGNHRSYFDPLAVGYAMARTGRPVRFLGKKEVFDAPVVGDLAKAMGGIRVERGTGSDEPLEQAAQVLRSGELVAIMPQGTIPRGRAFFDPELKGRWGTAKLAAMSGAPVVPMGLWGTEKVWPRNSKLPNIWNVTDPPTIRIRVGEPLWVGGEDVEADTEAIMAAIVELLPPAARVEREPTPEELARTLPAGYQGDPDAEVDRRPGTD
jgi:putative phosphoserine phosphatase / 1-acylglycerol-3-phosphate O-acyltransferase